MQTHLPLRVAFPPHPEHSIRRVDNPVGTLEVQEPHREPLEPTVVANVHLTPADSSIGGGQGKCERASKQAGGLQPGHRLLLMHIQPTFAALAPPQAIVVGVFLVAPVVRGVRASCWCSCCCCRRTALAENLVVNLMTSNCRHNVAGLRGPAVGGFSCYFCK